MSPEFFQVPESMYRPELDIFPSLKDISSEDGEGGELADSLWWSRVSKIFPNMTSSKGEGEEV